MKSNHPIFLFFFLSIFWTSAAAGQKNSVNGMVTDTTGVGLPAATLSLLQARDSVLTSFAISANDGQFELKRITAGDYLLQVTYVGYQTHWQPLKVSDNTGAVNIGVIRLLPAASNLDEVEVVAEHIPLRMRNDTLEYNAAAFQTQPGSVVEDLLKKLPGIEVERDGSIKAQGEQVRNVLVDGKEFFGNDPKIATKNLPADAVDRVQVYDKKSDKAEFTGIEDGRDEKTINLALKEDKKNGYFGNAMAGGGLRETQSGKLDPDRYEGTFNVNRFSGRTQLSAIGMLNNTNQQGFSLDEYIRFMGGLSNFLSGGGGSGSGRIRLSFDPSSMGIPLEGSGLDQGFTTTTAGGLNLNHEFNDRTELNASYFFSDLTNEQDRMTTRENLLSTGQFYSEEAENRISENRNHRLNLTLRHEIDSFQNLILRTTTGFNRALLNSAGTTGTFDVSGLPENFNERIYEADNENLSLSTRLTYRRRFRQKGRSFVTDLSWRTEQDDRQGLLEARNEYFTDGISSYQDSTDQSQRFKDDAGSYSLSLSYTEPLGKQLKHKSQYLELTAARQNFSNEIRKDFFDRFQGTEVLNTQLSNRYNRDYLYDRGGLNLLFNRKKYNLTLGAELQHSRLKGDLPNEGLIVKRDFTRLLPSLFLDYELGLSKHFNLEYMTRLQEPSLEQLQPVIDNSDPLNTYQGNPDLKPEYAHELNGQLMIFDQFTFTSLFANINATYTRDRITNSTAIDSLFRQHIQPVNVDNDLNLEGGIQFRTPLRFVQTNISLRYNTGWNRGLLFINEQENRVNRLRHSIGLSFDNRKKEIVDLTIGGRVSFNNTTYSTSENPDQRFFEQRYYSDLTVIPTGKWMVSTGFDYTIYSGESFGARQAIPLWKAGITRYLLPQKKGRLSLFAYDILNRNIGVSRSSQLNYTQESNIQNLARYFLLSFSYSISGFEKQQGGIEIRMENGR